MQRTSQGWQACDPAARESSYQMSPGALILTLCGHDEKDPGRSPRETGTVRTVWPTPSKPLGPGVDNGCNRGRDGRGPARSNAFPTPTVRPPGLPGQRRGDRRSEIGSEHSINQGAQAQAGCVGGAPGREVPLIVYLYMGQYLISDDSQFMGLQ